MKQLFLNVENGQVEILETPKPTIKDNYVIIQTHYSVVSKGTENSLSNFGKKNLLNKVKERPDQAKQIINKMKTDGVINTLENARNRLKEPLPLGYSGMGRVIEIGKGVTHVKKGDLVAMAGTAYHAEINRVGKNLVVKIPENIENPKFASFSALGAIALHSIHQAKVLPGESVGIIGYGLIGNILEKILTAYGSNVLVFDIKNPDFFKTNNFNYISVLNENLIQLVYEKNNGKLLDKVIIAASTDSNNPVEISTKIVRNRGRVCMLGVSKMVFDRSVFYEKEIDFSITRSYGPGRYETDYEIKGFDYPTEFVRFTEGRNIEEFLRLIESNKISLDDLVEKEIELNAIKDEYQSLLNSNYLGILIKYGQDFVPNNKIVHNTRLSNNIEGKIRVGIIGSGNFTTNILAPNLDKNKNFELISVASTGGVGLVKISKRYKVNYTTNDYKSILKDKDVNLIAITTQHNLHSKFIIEALENDKHVYCEKPLAIDLKQLESIKAAYKKTNKHLLVGFNRRYSNLIKKICENISKSKKQYIYHINTVALPANNWINDVKVGGGRIIGEAIHFIDLIGYLEKSRIESLDIIKQDLENSMINIVYSSGSIASIIYSTLGSNKYPKEILKIVDAGSIYIIENFVKLKTYGKSKTSKSLLKQDKGFLNQLDIFNEVLKNKTGYDTENIFHTHEKLLNAIEKIK